MQIRKYYRLFVVLWLLLICYFEPVCNLIADDPDPSQVTEKIIDSKQGVVIKVRMEGPYTADVPLQVVCYFQYTDEGVKKMQGAPIELDKRLGGIIADLREKGQFRGDAMETILIAAPKGSIKAKQLLLIGLGSENELSLDIMERVGKTALRTASMLGVSKVAFAPLIRDQGNNKLSTGNVERSVIRGVMSAYATDQLLQSKHQSKEFKLAEWWIEAGPSFYNETITAVELEIQVLAER